MALNCAALPESLVESELFGIEKGVATGVNSRVGQFQAADGGTLFLDEIGDLSLVAQAKILRVLEAKVVERVGGRTSIPVDVRVLSASNKDLDAEIKKLVDTIVAKPRIAVAMGKEFFYRQTELDIAAAYEAASQTMACNMMDEAALEGVQAFIEKRSPGWGQPGKR